MVQKFGYCFSYCARMKRGCQEIFGMQVPRPLRIGGMADAYNHVLPCWIWLL